MANRLSGEQSPYLLQHADNPVDWRPWGDEAFDAARREGKPIFLSIGYATCHWCHVMAHESFEHADVAALLNREFISIKVDREERPDIDRVYMTFVQATTGAGGWPLSVWLTPDRRPFYGGTYFPPSSRWGRPGFTEVLQEIARVWRDEPAKVAQSADALTRELSRVGERGQATGVPGVDALERGVAELTGSFDARNGGFGDAPKFPRPSELLFLFRESARAGRREPAQMALATLRAMALGGMRDHVGGGFHRYSVDAQWRVPHFEKMLYDQAQITLASLEAAQITGDRFYADLADDTLQYVARQMTDPVGGFYSAEDADSIPPEQAGQLDAHPSEGAFYLWRDEEIGEQLGDDAAVVRLHFGIEPGGNAPLDPQNEFTGKNLLYVRRDAQDIARMLGREPGDIRQALGRSRLRLFEARLQRPKPLLDDKVLTGWNGLMIAAFARAARVLSAFDETHVLAAAAHREQARRAAAFAREALWREDVQQLWHRWRRGTAGIDAYAEDYAALIFGLLELVQTDGDPQWLEWAIVLQRRMHEIFWDDAEGGWFATSGDDPTVLLRLKEEYDGAEPAAASLAAQNLLTLAHLTGDAAYLTQVEQVLGAFGVRLRRQSRAVPMMLAVLSTWHAQARSEQIAIVGRAGAPDTEALRATAGRSYRPFAIHIPIAVGVVQQRLAASMPFVGAMDAMGGAATAYVCQQFACRQPVQTPEALEGMLREGFARSEP
ncbi:MAG TPA: thioredoxin domain-containing protein [Vicinamibacterales bacterium]|jgi:hypothetical protein